MDISVIVSTYSKRRLNYILECFLSLKKQSLRPFETLLVLDPKPDLVKFYESKAPPQVKIIVSSERGLSNARNAGIQSATGEVVAFIDDDAVADQYWLENIAKNYDDSSNLGVGGVIKPLWETSCPEWFPEEFFWIVGCSYQGAFNQKITVRNPIGCNMSFRRDVFEKVGYFRSDIGRFGNRLLAGEEAEFSLRLLGEIPDSKIIHDPSAIVYHRVSQERLNLTYLIKRAFYEGLSKGLISNLNPSSPNALSTEYRYLRHLVSVALPSRLGRVYRLKSASQLSVSMLLIFAVFLGFARANGFSKRLTVQV